MSTKIPPKKSINDRAGGAILILIGVIYMLSEFYDFNLGQYSWPFFVIIPGIVAFVLALSLEEKTGKLLAHAGSVITISGLLLLYQNAFNHFESWAYAWALVLPTSIGIGQVIFGSVKKLDIYIENGKRYIKYGFAIFAVGFFFFELIIGLSGFGLNIIFGGYFLPLLLMALGLFFIFRRRGSDS